MIEWLAELWAVIVSLTIWTIVFSGYVFIGAFAGAMYSKTKKHDSDNLSWIIYGMALFGGILFPLTYYIIYTG